MLKKYIYIYTSGFKFIYLLLVNPLSLKKEEKIPPEIRPLLLLSGPIVKSVFLLEYLKIGSNESQPLSIVRSILTLNVSTSKMSY